MTHTISMGTGYLRGEPWDYYGAANVVSVSRTNCQFCNVVYNTHLGHKNCTRREAYLAWQKQEESKELRRQQELRKEAHAADKNVIRYVPCKGTTHIRESQAKYNRMTSEQKAIHDAKVKKAWDKFYAKRGESN